MRVVGAYSLSTMIARLLGGLLAASLVVALVGVAVLSLRPPTAATATGGEEAAESDRPCAAIQELYWRVSGGHFPGKGLGVTSEKLTTRAAEHGCELAAAPPDGWMPPAHDDDDDDEADDGGKGPRWAREGKGPRWAREGAGPRREGAGPRWAREGAGPRWGNAWGQRLRGHHGQAACARLAADAARHPDAGPPAGVKARLSEKFGCQSAEE